MTVEKHSAGEIERSGGTIPRSDALLVCHVLARLGMIDYGSGQRAPDANTSGQQWRRTAGFGSLAHWLRTI